jgi:MoaA/NifB/PqqE/SkfB family radical SAM enzyme
MTGESAGGAAARFRRALGRLLATAAARPLWSLTTELLFLDRLRPLLVRAGERAVAVVASRQSLRRPGWAAIVIQRKLVAVSILRTVDRLIGRRQLSRPVVRRALGTWAPVLVYPPHERPGARRFRGRYGVEPPFFLTLAPGRACNLACRGCYASATPEPTRLEWSVLDRIISQARSLWSAPLFVISGGEPLLYRSEGKDILDAAARHSDCLFLMFTNGTLIDDVVADRLAALGNLTPALSVEGGADRTDARRGVGTFEQILASMARLRAVGVPFGISVTATRANCEEVLSDEFLDLFFAEQGAFYGFIFQYLPIGREPALDRMITAEQRVEMWRRTWQAIEHRHIFLFDFWNHGPLVRGCMAAGRERGYLYIDWAGQVMPCVFAPYSVGDVGELFARGGDLNDLWEKPFLEALRGWQRAYGYGDAQLSGAHNWLRPCPFRDHHADFRGLVSAYQPQPEEPDAEAVLAGDAYVRGMASYDAQLACVLDPVWQELYLSDP